MENKFFTFFKPYLSFIDNGDLFRKPVSWLYIIIAFVNLLFPFYILYLGISSGIFSLGAKVVITFILIWIVLAFAAWLSFQLWWDRKSKVLATSDKGDEFIAIPVFSHIVQTFGEWLGTYIAVVGFLVSLFSTIILGKDANYILSGIPFMKSGAIFIIIMPLYGFITIVFTRFLAETFRALASIANNTKKS